AIHGAKFACAVSTCRDTVPRGRRRRPQSERRARHMDEAASQAMDDEDGHFGESVAATYDQSVADSFEPWELDASVDLLAELAGGGRALELAIGTGRIALPLASRGVEVHGIDMSRAMVARLRAKPGGDALAVTFGDFAATQVDGSFSLVYLV